MAHLLRRPRLLSLTAVLFIACHHPASQMTPAASLDGTAWRLEDLGGAGVIDNVEATLEFLADGKVAGRASCNRFFGTTAGSGQSLTISGIGSTRMACPAALMDQESKYLAALGKSRRYQLQGSTLLITYDGSEKPLRFTRTGQ